MQRAPLTTTHPHGYVLATADRRLGLLRISKNASTESKARLRCVDWIAFDKFTGPTVAFVRDPYARFMSSMPETVLRMTELLEAEADRIDRVVVPEDIYKELSSAAREPIETFARIFLELVEYTFFDAHHEAQVSFMADRHMNLRINPFLYPTEDFDHAIGLIEIRFGVETEPPGARSNQGGAKPSRGRTPAIDLARRLTRTGVHRMIRHSGVLGLRFRGSSGPMTIGELNMLANRFADELKSAVLDDTYKQRVLARYPWDFKLWSAVRACGGDIPAHEVWDVLSD